jgi:EAL domain-containing protein (putative c-di-GMP-specific phosphodiesterase class I)
MENSDYLSKMHINIIMLNQQEIKSHTNRYYNQQTQAFFGLMQLLDNNNVKL